MVLDFVGVVCQPDDGPETSFAPESTYASSRPTSNRVRNGCMSSGVHIDPISA